MPELPEVETIRRTLARHVVGRVIEAVEVRRPGMITGPATPAALMRGCRIDAIERRGKELLFRGTRVRGRGGRGIAPCFTLHLGMTGSLRYRAPKETRAGAGRATERHVHVLWHLDDRGIMQFRDPRMFGGIWTFACAEGARVARYHQRLGEDALTIKPDELYPRLQRTRRAIKATLLDQAVLAGLGNIYVDELLFSLRIHPLTAAHQLTRRQVGELVPVMRALLRRSIRMGATTLADGAYVDGSGAAGRFLRMLQAYGRAGEPCSRCGQVLRTTKAGGRTTVYCPRCQKRRR